MVRPLVFRESFGSAEPTFFEKEGKKKGAPSADGVSSRFSARKSSKSRRSFSPTTSVSAKAAEAILTVFPINAKTAGLSPKTAKRKVHHILLRGRDAVFPLSFRFVLYDRQADEVTICSAWQKNYGFVRWFVAENIIISLSSHHAPQQNEGGKPPTAKAGNQRRLRADETS